jgi:hypothetical protein
MLHKTSLLRIVVEFINNTTHLDSCQWVQHETTHGSSEISCCQSHPMIMNMTLPSLSHLQQALQENIFQWEIQSSRHCSLKKCLHKTTKWLLKIFDMKKISIFFDCKIKCSIPKIVIPRRVMEKMM